MNSSTGVLAGRTAMRMNARSWKTGDRQLTSRNTKTRSGTGRLFPDPRGQLLQLPDLRFQQVDARLHALGDSLEPRDFLLERGVQGSPAGQGEVVAVRCGGGEGLPYGYGAGPGSAASGRKRWRRVPGRFP